jgi:peptidoglycan hydrolase CwlO-like protein
MDNIWAGLFAFWWILIPLGGIAAGMFKDWLRFREKTRQLGTSTRELERTVAELQREVAQRKSQEAELTQRIENLEAIATSRLWNALRDEGLPAQEREALLARARAEHPLAEIEPPREPSPREKAERLARRLSV